MSPATTHFAVSIPLSDYLFPFPLPCKFVSHLTDNLGNLEAFFCCHLTLAKSSNQLTQSEYREKRLRVFTRADWMRIEGSQLRGAFWSARHVAHRAKRERGGKDSVLFDER